MPACEKPPAGRVDVYFVNRFKLQFIEMFACANGRVRRAAREIAHVVRGRVFAALTGGRLLRNREELIFAKNGLMYRKTYSGNNELFPRREAHLPCRRHTLPRCKAHSPAPKVHSPVSEANTAKRYRLLFYNRPSERKTPCPRIMTTAI